MTQPCRNGETSDGFVRRGMGKRGALAVGLVLFLIGACASTGESLRPMAAGQVALDPSGTLFAGAYRQIRDYYLDPVTIETLALAGVAGLDTGPDGLTIDDANHTIRLIDHGVELSRVPLPDADDPDGWAAVTSAAIAAARSHDAALADATDEQLYQRVFTGITAKLDRFTRYAGAAAAREQKAARDGFGGVGVTLDFNEAEPRVTTVLADGPSGRAGIRVDDHLIAIDGLPTAGLDQHQIVAKLRGRVGSRIALTVKRPQRDRAINVAVLRSLIVPVSVTAEHEDGVAIFHVASFNHDTARTLSQQMAQLHAEMGKNLTGIVLDLRGNPGGLLDQAVDVAGLFLGQGEIVATAGRHPTSMQNFEANGMDQTHGLPLVVLVNGGSASSAEIVAAALQDEGRAVVVGSSSYGKGTVQMVITLENTGELTLTWARLVTPSGAILHHHGIVPAFCTSEPVNPLAPPEEAPAQLARIIEQGLHPAPGIETRPRVSLTEADWETLRQSCPAETRDTALDLKVAKHLLKDPALYAQALTLPGIAVAHNPDGHAVRSALQ
jgi:carboxyl-terminal processing protease